MKVLVPIARILVGVLFIFSGLVKLNDPVGFSFKLEEYFAPDVLNIPFMIPLALEFAVAIVILEVLLGVALLIGHRAKLTVYLLLGMIVFFTFLTFYSAYFNKVTDCGCFGDAIPLTPWQSFYKDVILTILILILFIGQKYIRPIFSRITQTAALAVVLLACGFMAFWVLNHLPLKDFRPFAEGKSVADGMKSAEELGLEAPVYDVIYTMKNTDGAIKKITGTVYMSEKWWEKTEWALQEDLTTNIKVKDGYEPPIHDFSITTLEGDITEQVLASDNYILIIASNLGKSQAKGFEKIVPIMWDLEKSGADIPVLALTATAYADAEAYKHEIQAPFEFATSDETALKTVIRSNPGVVWLKKGVVYKKWHFNDVPSAEELNAMR